MSHVDLVARADRWLKNTRRCAVVATERRCWQTAESPDAIGWLPDGTSILVECKTNRADFLADQRKPHRGEFGMGRERWYLTDGQFISASEVPAGWGLLELRDDKVWRVVRAEVRPFNSSELPFLVAIARKALHGWRDGMSVGPGETPAADMEAA